MNVNLRIENVVNAEADTPDKFCYIDKAEKLSCKKGVLALFKNANSMLYQLNQCKTVMLYTFRKAYLSHSDISFCLIWLETIFSQ
ncbi:Uncharacterised protein [Orientia tsutsugamushi]|nr:Uncharacterised protein [Orientia tsutsugamushi]